MCNLQPISDYISYWNKARIRDTVIVECYYLNRLSCVTGSSISQKHWHHTTTSALKGHFSRKPGLALSSSSTFILCTGISQQTEGSQCWRRINNRDDTSTSRKKLECLVHCILLMTFTTFTSECQAAITTHQYTIVTWIFTYLHMKVTHPYWRDGKEALR